MPNLTRQAPLLRPVLFLISGIVVQYYRDIAFLSLALFFGSLLLMSVSFIPYINKCYARRWIFGVGVLSLCFTTGLFLTQIAWDKSDWPLPKELHTYTLRIIDEPIRKPKTYQCKAEILSADSFVHQQVKGKKVLLYLPIDERSQALVAGDALHVDVSLDKPSAFEGSTFDYPLYLRKQQYGATGFAKANDWQLAIIPIPWNEKIQYKALEVRRALLHRLRTLLPDDNHNAIAAALALGYKAGLDKDLRQQFSNVGAGHVLAISGLHFNILFGMIFFLFSFLNTGKKGRLTRLLLVLPLIWGFAFLTGFSPSVNRAACMMTVWIIGNTFFFRTFSINTIAVAALFMLLYNPLYLFDVSFQLSFSAVLAIVLLNPYLSSLLYLKNKILKYFWELSYISVAAQLGVLPLVIYYFHQLPVLFLVTNILIIPLVTVLLFLIPLTLFVSVVLGLKAAFPLKAVLDLFLGIIERLDSIPRAALSGITIDGFQTLLFYLCMLSACLLCIKKRIVWLYGLVLLSFVFYLSSFV